MNYRMVLGITGKIVLAEAMLLLLPTVIALYYGESNCLYAVLITIGVAVLFGGLATLLGRSRNKNYYAGEGFVAVSLSWIILSVIGCLPFVISGEIPRFADAIFETVSGFTTTGSSILTDVESMSKSLLFWRSFTHWVGGMGILVFVMAIIPSDKGSIHIMRAEMPGPIIGKLVPKATSTAKILYLIYMVLTVVEIVLLCLGGMPFFESIVHSLGTAGTGGFGIKADSVGGYSPYCQWVIAIFMLIFGVNFNLYYLLLIRRIRAAVSSRELWAYFSIIGVSAAIIITNTFSLFHNFAEALRHGVFQVASIITTTGYATVDFNTWPDLSKAVLLILMFVGGCAGSTAGGLKVSRVCLIFKLIGREIKRMLHPRSVTKVRFEGKVLEESTLNNVVVYLAVYLLCLVGIFFLLCLEPFGLETNLTAAITCFNNIGPGFDLVGPAGNFSAYSDFSKYILSFAMLLGRLEIFPIIIALSPTTWVRKRR